MNRCARNVSEMASAIEKCISYLLSTYKYNNSKAAKLISDTFLCGGGHRSGILFLASVFLFFIYILPQNFSKSQFGWMSNLLSAQCMEIPSPVAGRA